MEEGPTPGGDRAGEAWLESHGRCLGHFVGGTWLKPPGRGSLESRGGPDGRAVASVPDGEGSDVAEAVGAAAAAAEGWGRLGGPRRGRSLHRLALTLEGPPGGALGGLLSLFGGRPLRGTLGADLDLALRLLRAAAGGAQLGPPGLEGWTPLGVVAVAVAGPCSVPALLWKVGPALAMGNTVLVLCPPEVAPPLLYLAELSGQGGALPPGVLNVVTGPLPGLCRALRAHPTVTAITFLGPPQEQVQGLAWGSPCRGPRVGWARGGRVVVVVLDSADLDGAAAAIAGAAGTPPALFPWGGCVVLAQEGVLAPLERRLRARLGGLRVGDPLDPGTDVGPLPPTGPHPRELVEAAREEGAEVFQPLPPPPGGRFYPPTLITGVAPTSRCLREPAAGPVLVLLPVRSPGEAAAVASSLPLVAAAAVWAQDVTAGLDTAQRLPQGLVWLNELNLLDPSGGCAAGAAETTLEEALREFGRPPWEQPPELEGPLSPSPEEAVPDPQDAELAGAVVAARAAALGWGRLPGLSRARVLRGAAAALGGPGGTPGGDDGDDDGRLQGALLRWAAHAERMGGAVQEVPGGRALVLRRPLGVVGVVWSWPRPWLPELLLPALALGNGVVVVAPPGGAGAALHLRQVLVAAGLPGGALAVLPGGSRGSRGSGAKLARQHPDGLWLCGADTDWTSALSVPRVWGVPGGLLGAPGQDPPPGAARELELRCTRPQCLWVPGGAP
ncbi:LOW QUALITY PROTEIN: aldehyde dehydrogenase family 16 member A1 [Manacus candei]|uniref:LOW QUALITY PROTEIN: aldehyde dehydrogenase family 16 member A1 n=1 Tax=Manacus candei TaxID=415023 RepID=UPI00222752FF|nr:LOW QUALITY PROTEIN: aldehyde dehydrogenase family 16 member A1 [Manacus candei]